MEELMMAFRAALACFVLICLTGLSGCSEDVSREDSVRLASGKTPVVQPEDIHGGKTLDAATPSPGQSTDIASSSTPAGQPRDNYGPTGQPVAAEAGTGTGFSAGPLHTSRQLILIVASDWNAPQGEVVLYSRENTHSSWKRLENTIPCMLGRNGLAWGRGLVDQDIPGPRKKEGDGRTPAGLFPLPFVFGYDSSATAKQSGVRMPYFELTPSMVCVTDGHSPVFNEIADIRNPKGASWTRQDRMVRDNNANRLGVFVGHNRRDPKPEAGSCVFLDIQPTQPTGGSIGCPETAVRQIMVWLDPASNPVIAILPQSVLASVQSKWGLP
ncbi:MAG: L,D-transpeptidase family protein [Thermodesulfobacteriota bacterium]